MKIERLSRPEFYGDVYQILLDHYSLDTFPGFMGLVAEDYARQNADALAKKLGEDAAFRDLVATKIAAQYRIERNRG